MGLMNLFVAACLRAATRRWPADVRDDMAREWAAEISALEGQHRSWWRRLTFAASLAVTPLVIDESGAPRGRWEWMRAGATLRTVSRLLLAGAFGFGISMGLRIMANGLIEVSGDDDSHWLLVDLAIDLVTAAVTTGYTVVTGRWASSRGAPEPGPAGSLGVAATGVLPLAALLFFFLGMHTAAGPVLCLAVTACWAAAALTLVVSVVRTAGAGRNARAWVAAGVGVPLTAALPAIPLAVWNTPDLPAYLVADIACYLLPWTVCTVVFGRTTVRRWATGVPPAMPVADSLPETTGSAAGLVERAVLLVLATASAVAWALGVTVLQPLSEPTGVDAYAENNTYWARELRWGALLALVLVVLVYARGDRRLTRGVLLGGLAWLAADIVLDRIDPASGTVVLAITAAGVAILGCLAVGAVPAVPRPRVLFTVATVAAIASGTTTGTESPTDTEHALNLGSAAVGSLLAVVAVVAALGAAGSVSRARASVAVPLAAVAAGVPWLLRHLYPQPTGERSLATLALCVLLVFAAVVLAGPRPRSGRDWPRYPAALAVATVTLPVLGLPLLFVFIALPVGDVFTALAGNPAIDSADEDLITDIIAVIVGLVLGRALRSLALPRPASPRPARRTAPAVRAKPLLTPPDLGREAPDPG